MVNSAEGILLKVLCALQIPKRFPTYEGDYYGNICCRRTLKLLCGVVTWSFFGASFQQMRCDSWTENTIKPPATITWKTFIASPYVCFAACQQPACCKSAWLVQQLFCKSYQSMF
ncbi:conserved hypothetical protein [Trichinella spiralis]|uniref:hypothetical protein n=1 Tax=Trichinella spiralis TaxID=6334 RepID=UPI0001EFC301|nr:conserved hypothetical protein [Trichinella spiralis]